MNDLKIFSGRANPALSQSICEYLGLPLGKIAIGNFADGEIACKIEEDVRGRDVFLVQPTCPPVNENLMELLIMIESFKRASAERITAVMPYFGYARTKDACRSPPSWWPTSSLGPAPTACWPWTCTPPRSRAFSTFRSITCMPPRY
jgi:ribose-phosphate pyrophosphokinase